MNLVAWLLPLLSGVCDAASRGVIKTAHVHKFTLVSAGFFFALPFYLVWLLFSPPSSVNTMFWIAVAVHVPLLAWANVLTIEAHRQSPLILTMPYLSFTPAFLLVSSPLMGLGWPTILGVVGVLILTAGLYVLNAKSDQTSVLAPLKSFFKEKGSRKMFVVALIFAVTSNLDYIALKNANAPFYLLVDHGLVAIAMAGLAILYLRLGRNDGLPISPAKCWRTLMAYGFVIAASVIFHMVAFRWIATVSYVIASKRAGSILFTIILGFWMAFILRHKDFDGERENLKYRLPGVMMMVAGMIVIILWGKTA